MKNPDNADSPDIFISRTQKKKEDHALQKLGERLTELSEVQLERISLPDRILEEVLLARKTTAHGARKRLVKHIGAMLRQADTGPIEKELEHIDRADYEQKLAFKRLEDWRDRLRSGELELINSIIVEFPYADRRKLGQLARNARKEHETGKGTKASRALFRCLKEVFENGETI